MKEFTLVLFVCDNVVEDDDDKQRYFIVSPSFIAAIDISATNREEKRCDSANRMSNRLDGVAV